MSHPETVRWDRATYAGIIAVAVAAVVLSASSLSGLARMVGITGHLGGFRLAWLLPIAVDAYAVTATRVWLRTGVALRTRIYARRNSIGAIGLSVAGNATFHGLSAAGVATLTGAGYGWLLVVAVSAVPPVMLGLVGHLHALISAEHRPGPDTTTAESVPASAVPAPATETSPAPFPDRDTAPESRQSRPAKNSRSRSTGPTRSRTSRTGPASTGSGTPTTGKTAGAETAMRAHWTAERAAGRTPTGAELDRVAGTRDYGRKVRRTLLAEDDTGPATGTTDQAGTTDQRAAESDADAADAA